MGGGGRGLGGPRPWRRGGSALGAARRDLRLYAENISVFDGGVKQGLGVLYLAAGILVVKLVAERSAVRAVLGKTQLLDQHGDNLVGGSVVRKFNRHSLVFGGIVHSDCDICHFCPIVSVFSLMLRWLIACRSAHLGVTDELIGKVPGHFVFLDQL